MKMPEYDGRRQLQKSIEYFIENWRPEDSRDAARFSAELHMIVRDVYMDMQTPVTQCMDAVLARTIAPHPFIIREK